MEPLLCGEGPRVAREGHVSTLDIRFFGIPRILYLGDLVAFKAPPRALLLMAYLTMNPGAVPRKRAAFLLWPDDDEERAQANLRRHVALLEKTLPQVDEPWLRKDRTTIAWVTDGRSAVDSTRFEALSADPRTYRDAADLYVGDFMDVASEEWVVAHRDRLRDRQLSLLHSLTRQHEVSGDLATALDYAKRAWRLDPWREDILRDVMRLHRELDDVAGALATYRSFELRARAELGVAPMPETSAAIHQILTPARADDGTKGTEAWTAPTKLETPNNLPMQLSPLIGRSREVAEIQHLLARSKLVTVTGIGGVGKTRVALQVARALLPSYRDGVLLVEFAQIQDERLIASCVLSALGVAHKAARSSTDTLIDHLGQRTLLLVLDNCEQIIDSVAPLATSMLRACPNVTLLLTSREPLRISSEQTYALPPLATAPPRARMTAVEALYYDATALFVTRASATLARFRFSDENAFLVAQICRRLDGIPLAIELAAARVGVLSIQQLSDHVSNHLRVLGRGGRDVPLRQRTMRAVFDWSYGLLSQREQQLFHRLAIFVGGWSLDAACEVCSGDDLGAHDILDLLSSLVTKSLVVATPEADDARYSLLETTRLYALERLRGAAASERPKTGPGGGTTEEILASRHLQYFRRFVEGAESLFEATGNDAAFVAAVTPEARNIRAAMLWSLAGGSTPDGAALAASSGRVLFRSSLVTEAAEWLERFARHAEGGNRRTLARLWLVRSLLAAITSSAAEALGTAERAVAIARTAGDGATLSEALARYSYAKALTRHLDEAEAALDEAVEVAGPEASPLQRLRVHDLRGYFARLRGDQPGAIRAYESLREINRSVGNEFGEAVTVVSIAEAEHACGQTAKAILLIRSILPRAESLLGPDIQANVLNNLAGYLASVDDIEGARAAAAESVALLGSRGSAPAFFANGLGHLALALALQGDHERAARLFGYCEATLSGLGFSRESTEQKASDRLNHILCAAMSPDRLAELLRDGAIMTREMVVELALQG